LVNFFISRSAKRGALYFGVRLTDDSGRLKPKNLLYLTLKLKKEERSNLDATDGRTSERFVQTLSFLFKDICALITPQTGNFSISLDDDRFTVLQQSIRKKAEAS
jgi:hypothetical protein